MGERRDQATDDASITCASEEEEASDESAFLIIVFSDGVRYSRFSITSGAAEPTHRLAGAVVSPTRECCDDILSSSRVAVGSRWS